MPRYNFWKHVSMHVCAKYHSLRVLYVRTCLDGFVVHANQTGSSLYFYVLILDSQSTYPYVYMRF